MKRADIKRGETYAVLAPSQKVKSYFNAKKVTILDTDPAYCEAGTSWFGSNRNGKYGYGAGERGKVRANGVAVNDVYARPLDDGELGNTYTVKAARRVVYGLREESSAWPREEPPRYALVVVPISQVRMTWAEYEDRVADEQRKRKSEDAAIAREAKAKAQAKVEAAKRRDADVRIVRAALLRNIEGTEAFDRLVGKEKL